MKRQRMMDFLARIKEEHKDNDAMLIVLGEIEIELNAKKYGLVWEEHEEAVDVKMRTHMPVFKECTDKEITAAAGEVSDMPTSVGKPISKERRFLLFFVCDPTDPDYSDL